MPCRQKDTKIVICAVGLHDTLLSVIFSVTSRSVLSMIQYSYVCMMSWCNTELSKHAGDACFKCPVSKISLNLDSFIKRCSPLPRVKVLFFPSSSSKYCIQEQSSELLSMHSHVTDCVAWEITSRNHTIIIHIIWCSNN